MDFRWHLSPSPLVVAVGWYSARWGCSGESEVQWYFLWPGNLGTWGSRTLLWVGSVGMFSGDTSHGPCVPIFAGLCPVWGCICVLLPGRMEAPWWGPEVPVWKYDAGDLLASLGKTLTPTPSLFSFSPGSTLSFPHWFLALSPGRDARAELCSCVLTSYWEAPKPRKLRFKWSQGMVGPVEPINYSCFLGWRICPELWHLCAQGSGLLLQVTFFWSSILPEFQALI